jgi:hypothetical protein
MIRALLAFVGALTTSAAVSGPCPAQQRTQDAPIRGVLSTSALVERSVAFTVCPSSAGGNPDETDVGPLTTVLTRVCSVERTDVLGEGDGVQWTAVRYITLGGRDRAVLRRARPSFRTEPVLERRRRRCTNAPRHRGTL